MADKASQALQTRVDVARRKRQRVIAKKQARRQMAPGEPRIHRRVIKRKAPSGSSYTTPAPGQRAQILGVRG